MTSIRHGDHRNSASIPCRLSGGCPSAISRLIVSARVNSIQDKPRRAGAKVPQESREVRPPLFAHYHTATSIGRVTEARSVVTPRLRVCPRPILQRFAVPPDWPRRGTLPASHFPAETTAARRGSGCQGLVSCDRCSPAGAQAQPRGAIPTLSVKRYHGKSPVHLSGSINPEHGQSVSERTLRVK